MTEAVPARRTGRRTLRHDSLTLNIYTYFIAWGWFLYAFAPTVPILAEEWGISRSIAGLHGTAMACGNVVVGFTAGRLVRRFGRRKVIVAGGALLIVGIAVLVLGPGLPFTLTGAFLTTCGGPLAVIISQSALSVHHEETGSMAISEANAIGAGFGLVAPLALGAVVGIGWGWRPAIVVTAAVTLVAVLWTLRVAETPALSGRATSHPAEVAESAPRQRARYSRAFWAFLGSVVVGAAVENATTYWASDLIRTQTGADQALATAAVAGMVGGLFVCRLIIGPVSLRKAPEKLLILAYVIAIAGWFLFWSATTPVMAFVGLVVMGLGAGAHYPMSIVLVIRSSAGRPDQALALSSLATGLAVGVAPFALGALSDSIGPHQAFVIIPILAVLGIVTASLGLREVRRDLRQRAHQES